MKSLDVVLNDSENRELPNFWQEKYRQQQVRNWDIFYKNNEARFFKDRSWLKREFKELETQGYDSVSPKTSFSEKSVLIDIGCGVGNASIPLLENGENFEVLAFDCSPRAVALYAQRWEGIAKVSSHAVIGEVKAVGVWDVCESDKPSSVYTTITDSLKGAEPFELNGWSSNIFVKATMDLEKRGDTALLLFVLSAIPPERMSDFVKNVLNSLKVGGQIVFRDYGKYDAKEIRFASRKNSKLADDFYVRQDGTLAFYFEESKIKRIFETDCGLKVLSFQKISREFTNRKTGQKFNRIWYQAIYQRIC